MVKTDWRLLIFFILFTPLTGFGSTELVPKPLSAFFSYLNSKKHPPETVLYVENSSLGTSDAIALSRAIFYQRVMTYVNGYLALLKKHCIDGFEPHEVKGHQLFYKHLKAIRDYLTPSYIEDIAWVLRVKSENVFYRVVLIENFVADKISVLTVSPLFRETDQRLVEGLRWLEAFTRSQSFPNRELSNRDKSIKWDHHHRLNIESECQFNPGYDTFRPSLKIGQLYLSKDRAGKKRWGKVPTLTPGNTVYIQLPVKEQSGIAVAGLCRISAGYYAYDVPFHYDTQRSTLYAKFTVGPNHRKGIYKLSFVDKIKDTLGNYQVPIDQKPELFQVAGTKPDIESPVANEKGLVYFTKDGSTPTVPRFSPGEWVYVHIPISDNVKIADPGKLLFGVDDPFTPSKILSPWKWNQNWVVFRWKIPARILAGKYRIQVLKNILDVGGNVGIRYLNINFHIDNVSEDRRPPKITSLGFFLDPLGKRPIGKKEVIPGSWIYFKYQLQGEIDSPGKVYLSGVYGPIWHTPTFKDGIATAKIRAPLLPKKYFPNVNAVTSINFTYTNHTEENVHFRVAEPTFSFLPKLRQLTPISEALGEKWIQDMASTKYKQRQGAYSELQKWGNAASKLIEAKLEEEIDREMRVRLEKLSLSARSWYFPKK